MADCGLRPGRPLVIGFSGGPDSYALLHALHAAGWSLLVAHLDHGLRPESAADAKRAGEIAGGLGLPCFSERVNVAVAAESGGLGIEEAARMARYEFLFRVAGEQDAQAVAVAHNSDDQAETVLMHLLRGAGGAGLRGMSMRLLPNPWSAAVPLVRPLLNTSRAEVLEYCEQHGLDALIDSSNTDTTYFRNRLRHELLPLLEGYAPGIRTRLQQTAALLAADGELLERLTQEAWRRCLARRGPGFVGLQRAVLLQEPLAQQRAVLRRAAGDLRPDLRDLDFDAVERARAVIRGNKTAQQDWFGGLSILIEGDLVWLAEWDAQLPAEWPQAAERPMHIEAPGSVELAAGWRLTLSEAAPDLGQAQQNSDRFQTWVDMDAAGEELVLRRPRRGDRLRPIGLGGTQTLADLFTNAKLPRRARAAWPLLCRDEDIVWVPGYALAQPYRLQADTRRALHVELKKSSV
jgi:tRNA(Ile)-lysidine synthase